MTPNRMDTIPLPVALHLAVHTVIGLFSMYAGFLNMIDPWVKGLQGMAFFTLMGFSWGYVYGIVMARKEVVMLGFMASGVYAVAGLWRFAGDWLLGTLLFTIGVYGFFTLAAYRRHILET